MAAYDVAGIVCKALPLLVLRVAHSLHVVTPALPARALPGHVPLREAVVALHGRRAYLRPGPHTRFLTSSTSLVARGVPVYPHTLAALSSLACPLIRFPAQPDWLLMVYRCTSTHAPHSPPWPGHAFPFQLNLTVDTSETLKFKLKWTLNRAPWRVASARCIDTRRR
jgi:hypothetical protein